MQPKNGQQARERRACGAPKPNRAGPLILPVVPVSLMRYAISSAASCPRQLLVAALRDVEHPHQSSAWSICMSTAAMDRVSARQHSWSLLNTWGAGRWMLHAATDSDAIGDARRRLRPRRSLTSLTCCCSRPGFAANPCDKSEVAQGRMLWVGTGADLPDRCGSFSLRSTRPLSASSMQKQGPYLPGSVHPRHARPPMSNATLVEVSGPVSSGMS